MDERAGAAAVVAAAEVAAAAALRRLLQLQPLSFGGGFRGLGCVVWTPVRGPGCSGGACKNPRGARECLTERAGVRGQRARSRGLRLVFGVWEAGSQGPRRSHRHAFLPIVQAGALRPLSSPAASWGYPRSWARTRAGSTWSWSPHSPSVLFSLICSSLWRPQATHLASDSDPGQAALGDSRMAAGPLSRDLSPGVTPSGPSTKGEAKPAERALA